MQSSNGGTTWDSPIKVNQDSTTSAQWQPAMSVKPSGNKLFIGWYSREDDLVNNEFINVYGVVANLPVTGGSSFAGKFRISTESFPPVFTGTQITPGAYDPVYPPSHPSICPDFDGTFANHMGDYDTAVSDNSYFYYTWGDNRNLTQGTLLLRKQADIRFVRVTWP